MVAASHGPVRAFATAIDERDVEAAVALCDPEIEFLSVLALDGQAYVGHGDQAVLRRRGRCLGALPRGGSPRGRRT